MNCKKKTAAVRVDAGEYLVSRGFSPRGRGSWAFAFDDQSVDDLEGLWWAPGSVPYAEARRAAIAEARRRGATLVKVCS